MLRQLGFLILISIFNSETLLAVSDASLSAVGGAMDKRVEEHVDPTKDKKDEAEKEKDKEKEKLYKAIDEINKKNSEALKQAKQSAEARKSQEGGKTESSKGPQKAESDHHAAAEKAAQESSNSSTPERTLEPKGAADTKAVDPNQNAKTDPSKYAGTSEPKDTSQLADLKRSDTAPEAPKTPEAAQKAPEQVVPSKELAKASEASIPKADAAKAEAPQAKDPFLTEQVKNNLNDQAKSADPSIASEAKENLGVLNEATDSVQKTMETQASRDAQAANLESKISNYKAELRGEATNDLGIPTGAPTPERAAQLQQKINSAQSELGFVKSLNGLSDSARTSAVADYTANQMVQMAPNSMVSPAQKSAASTYMAGLTAKNNIVGTANTVGSQLKQSGATLGAALDWLK